MNKETEAMNVGEKLKIAHVLKSSIYSGAENVVLTIMKGLREEFEFLYIATEGPIREKLEEIPAGYRTRSRLFSDGAVRGGSWEIPVDIAFAL